MDKVDIAFLKTLCAFSFDVLNARLKKTEEPEYPTDIPDPKSPLFVSWKLKENDKNRGCIGTFEIEYLSINLKKYAIISAFQDHRFPPIQIDEVRMLKGSVNLLTNFEEIENPLDWEVGKHGIQIEFEHDNENYKGTYLPFVAESQGWDQKTTLQQLCKKAGFSGSFETVKNKIQTDRYQSKVHDMSYDEYLEWKLMNHA